MALYENFPYTNYHDINLDRIIQQLMEVKEGLQFVIDNASLKYADPLQWSITHQYQANTVVIDPETGIAYISTKPVPDNIQITDTGYWTPIFDLSDLFSDLTTETENRINADTALGERIDQEILDRQAADTALAKTGYYLNVKKYGAVGDGVTDDTQAFIDAYTDANAGSKIYIPQGTYLLSSDPDDGTKSMTWLMDAGTKLIGSGVGNPSIGAGTFGATYVSNPWLITTGDYYMTNTDGVVAPTGGAVNAWSMEMKSPTFDSATHRWLNMMYIGTNTGDPAVSENTDAHVEIMNQVLNVTGQKGIMMELDLNTYKSLTTFSVALFITGGGSVNSPCTAIDIQRDTWLTHWTNGISIRQADTALFTENTTNGFIMNRSNDNTAEGNAFQVRTVDGNTELAAIGCDGWLRAKGINLLASVTAETITPDHTLIIQVNGTDYKVPVVTA